LNQVHKGGSLHFVAQTEWSYEIEDILAMYLLDLLCFEEVVYPVFELVKEVWRHSICLFGRGLLNNLNLGRSGSSLNAREFILINQLDFLRDLIGGSVNTESMINALFFLLLG
jgi:hypothetical protein